MLGQKKISIFFFFQIVFDHRLSFDLPQQKICNKTKSVENNLVKVYIF